MMISNLRKPRAWLFSLACVLLCAAPCLAQDGRGANEGLPPLDDPLRTYALGLRLSPEMAADLLLALDPQASDARLLFREDWAPRLDQLILESPDLGAAVKRGRDFYKDYLDRQRGYFTRDNFLLAIAPERAAWQSLLIFLADHKKQTERANLTVNLRQRAIAKTHAEHAFPDGLSDNDFKLEYPAAFKRFKQILSGLEDDARKRLERGPQLQLWRDRMLRKIEAVASLNQRELYSVLRESVGGEVLLLMSDNRKIRFTATDLANAEVTFAQWDDKSPVTLSKPMPPSGSLIQNLKSFFTTNFGLLSLVHGIRGPMILKRILDTQTRFDFVRQRVRSSYDAKRVVTLRWTNLLHGKITVHLPHLDYLNLLNRFSPAGEGELNFWRKPAVQDFADLQIRARALDELAQTLRELGPEVDLSSVKKVLAERVAAAQVLPDRPVLFDRIRGSHTPGEQLPTREMLKWMRYAEHPDAWRLRDGLGRATAKMPTEGYILMGGRRVGRLRDIAESGLAGFRRMSKVSQANLRAVALVSAGLYVGILGVPHLHLGNFVGASPSPGYFTNRDEPDPTNKVLNDETIYLKFAPFDFNRALPDFVGMANDSQLREMTEAPLASAPTEFEIQSTLPIYAIGSMVPLPSSFNDAVTSVEAYDEQGRRLIPNVDYELRYDEATHLYGLKLIDGRMMYLGLRLVVGYAQRDALNAPGVAAPLDPEILRGLGRQLREAGLAELVNKLDILNADDASALRWEQVHKITAGESFYTYWPENSAASGSEDNPFAFFKRFSREGCLYGQCDAGNAFFRELVNQYYLAEQRGSPWKPGDSRRLVSGHAVNVGGFARFGKDQVELRGKDSHMITVVYGSESGPGVLWSKSFDATPLRPDPRGDPRIPRKPNLRDWVPTWALPDRARRLRFTNANGGEVDPLVGETVVADLTSVGADLDPSVGSWENQNIDASARPRSPRFDTRALMAAREKLMTHVGLKNNARAKSDEQLPLLPALRLAALLDRYARYELSEQDFVTSLAKTYPSAGGSLNASRIMTELSGLLRAIAAQEERRMMALATMRASTNAGRWDPRSFERDGLGTAVRDILRAAAAIEFPSPAQSCGGVFR